MRTKEIYITYKGERKTLGEWAIKKDVSWLALYQRIVRRGWPVTKAMETPFQKNTKPARKQVVVEYTDEHDHKENV